MPELLELPELSLPAEELPDGAVPVAVEPEEELMPELELDMEPDGWDGLLLHAANKSAQASGDNHFNIRPP